MSNRIRRGLFAAAGLIGGLVAQPARADGDIEKPPGVPPEVTAARTACPTLTGPCHGFYPTRWRVLPVCCVAPEPVVPVVPVGPVTPAAPVPDRPKMIPPASGAGTRQTGKAPKTEKAPAKPDVVPVAVPAVPEIGDLPVIKPPTPSEVYPPPPDVKAADIVIPPPPPAAAPAPKAVTAPADPKPRANRPLSAEVVPQTSKLRR